MKTISIMLAKGGVGKTISSANIGYILATKYNKKVLLVDVDPQGNLSKMYNRYSDDKKSISNLLLYREIDIKDVIQNTDYENIDIITSNSKLVNTNNRVLTDTTSVQQTRLKKHFKNIKDEYDYCIFDCSAEFNISTINAFVVSDEVLIPTKVDSFSFDAILKVRQVIEEMQELNERLKLKGCFVTMYQNTNLNKKGIDLLQNQSIVPVFQTVIRQTIKVSESTFNSDVHLNNGILCEIYPQSTASEDYYNLVAEFVK